MAWCQMNQIKLPLDQVTWDSKSLVSKSHSQGQGQDILDYNASAKGFLHKEILANGGNVVKKEGEGVGGRGSIPSKSTKRGTIRG